MVSGKPPAPHVLVVDDEEALVDLICNMLKMAHITADPCPIGEQAHPYIRQVMPKLVIIDVMMPDVNGLTLLQRLRSDVVTQAIPVLLITAGSFNVNNNLTYFRKDYDGFLQKPFGIHALINTVRTMLRGNVTTH